VSNPLVSVIMASHNAAPFIGEALESVLSQSYEELELIVVDDCSSDGTAEVVAEYSERMPDRLRWTRKKQREGPCRARNDALALVRGHLVCWMDHDDIWMRTKVEEQVRVFEQQPEVGLVYSYFDAFDSDSGETISWPDGRRDFAGDVLADLLVTGCFIGSITTMFRSEALDSRGRRLRDRDFSIGDDYYLWLAIAHDWRVVRIPRVLARYRRHPGNESTRVASEIDFHRWRVGLLHEFFKEFPTVTNRLSRRDRMALAWQFVRAARLELTDGHLRQAGREAIHATMLDPAALGRSFLGTRAPRAARDP
jgi:glycosyltransferase involved in cell wall biosynthesis